MKERTELVAFEIAIVIDIPIRGTAVMVQIPEGTHDAALTYTWERDFEGQAGEHTHLIEAGRM